MPLEAPVMRTVGFEVMAGLSSGEMGWWDAGARGSAGSAGAPVFGGPAGVDRFGKCAVGHVVGPWKVGSAAMITTIIQNVNVLMMIDINV